MRKRKYHQLSKAERSEIEILRSKGYLQKDIARALGRNKSTISREITRNRKKKRVPGGRQPGPYQAKLAQHKARLRRADGRYQGKKINEDKELRKYIIKGLNSGWSPDEISGRMKEKKKPFYVSKTAIYEWLYSVWGQRYCQLLYSQKKKPKPRKKKKTQRQMIPNRIGIEKRPQEANLRLKYGHYEGDTIVSKKNTSSITAIAERKAKYVSAKKIGSLKPLVNERAIEKMAEGLKEIKTLTLDNGIENKDHQKLRVNLGLETYFCDPYSSWQKGFIENINKMIRRYIPKGSDLRGYSQEYLDCVCSILNNKPRRSLGYKTPLEVMVENGLLKESEIKQNQLLGNSWLKVDYLAKLKTINNKKQPSLVALRG